MWRFYRPACRSCFVSSNTSCGLFNHVDSWGNAPHVWENPCVISAKHKKTQKYSCLPSDIMEVDWSPLVASKGSIKGLNRIYKVQCLHNLEQTSPNDSQPATASPSVHDESSTGGTFGGETQNRAANAVRASPYGFHRGVHERLATLRSTSRYRGERLRGSASPSDSVLLGRRARSLWGGELLYLRLRRSGTIDRFIKSPLLRLCSHFIPPWKRHYTYGRLVAHWQRKHSQAPPTNLIWASACSLWDFSVWKTFFACVS